MVRPSDLDVLITVSALTPKGWVNRCRRSVAEAAKLADIQVNVIEVPGVPGNIGQAMANGVAMGTGRYVAWVDDDDFVLPNAFVVLGNGIRAGADAVCAREIALLANGNLVPSMKRHHLTAWQRDVVNSVRLEEHPAFPLVPLLEAVEHTAIDELAWVYVRRVRADSGGAMLRREHGRNRF